MALALLAGGVLAGGVLAGCERSPQPSAAELVDGGQRVEIKADTSGFQPSTVRLRQGTPAVLAFTRVVDSDCVDAVKMPWMEKPVDLPLHETVEIAVDTSKTG